jgi:hypothetical protein
MGDWGPGAQTRRRASRATGLEAFDKSIQTTNIWLNEIMEDIGPDRPGTCWARF